MGLVASSVAGVLLLLLLVVAGGGTTSDGISNSGTVSLECDPSEIDLLARNKNGCGDKDCADPVWGDGCEACMCFNPGNAAWCDGSRGDDYDNYFKAQGVNPWGDRNVRNQKCK